MTKKTETPAEDITDAALEDAQGGAMGGLMGAGKGLTGKTDALSAAMEKMNKIGQKNPAINNMANSSDALKDFQGAKYADFDHDI